MIYLISFIIVAISALLWRIRGGLWKEYIPENKIWYALFFGIFGYFYFGNSLEKAIVGGIACFTSYKLYGWGLYLGRLLEGGQLNPNLVQYPKWFGVCGTTLTGLIITFLWGLYFGSLPLMLSGLGMGICYWLGGKLEKLKALGKSGWNWGEWIFGAYAGACLVWMI